MKPRNLQKKNKDGKWDNAKEEVKRNPRSEI